MKVEKILLLHDIDGRLVNALLHVTAPIGWWADFGTYNIGRLDGKSTIKAQMKEKPFEWEDFDARSVVDEVPSIDEVNGPDYRYAHGMLMATIIESLNAARDRYLDYESRSGGWEYAAALAWEQILGLLPQSYCVTRDLTLDEEDIKMILNFPYGAHHWDDLHQFIEKNTK